MQVGEKVTRSAQLITTPSGRTTETYCGSTGSSTGAGVGVGEVVGAAIGGDLTRGVACFFFFAGTEAAGSLSGRNTL